MGHIFVQHYLIKLTRIITSNLLHRMWRTTLYMYPDIAVIINVCAVDVNMNVWYFRRTYRRPQRGAIVSRRQYLQSKYRWHPLPPTAWVPLLRPLCKVGHACLMRANLGLLRESSQCQHTRLSEICYLCVSQRKPDFGDAGFRFETVAGFRFETVLHDFYYSARERDSSV